MLIYIHHFTTVITLQPFNYLFILLSKIHRSVVDHYRGQAGDLLPCCQLRLSHTGIKDGGTLSAKIMLRGAKKPSHYFMVLYEPTIAGT